MVRSYPSPRFFTVRVEHRSMPDSTGAERYIQIDLIETYEQPREKDGPREFRLSRAGGSHQGRSNGGIAMKATHEEANEATG